VVLFLLACNVSIATVHGQTTVSAKQRMEAVQEHLSRYVILKGSSNTDLQLASQMAALHVPAVSMAAIRDGRIDWAQAYGVSSLGGRPVSTRTLFGAASISKAVTALGVLKLVEERRIDLDVDVNHYLKRWNIPDNQFTAKNKVTVRELLNHTSGIGTHNGDIYDPSLPLPTLLQLLNGEKPARTPPVRVEAVPGTKFAYSNGGYLVLYLLVEDVTGETFASFMKHAVFDPIGMKNSTFDAPLSTQWAARAATSYWGDGTTAVPSSKFVEPNLAAGGLWTTPTDLAKFLVEVQREYAGSSHKVLNQSTVQLIPKRGLGPWGLGFRVGGEPGNLYVRHEGSAIFQDDMFAYLHGGGFIVMTSGGDGGTLTEELFRSAGKVYGFPDFKPVEHSAVAVAPVILSSYVGTYGFIKVAMEGDTLTAEIPAGSKPARLYAESSTRFFVLDGPQELSFDVDAQQKVTGVEFITPINRRPLKKTEEDGKE
jgi:CubicO group peptidase (beta-lactamase class C family)